MSREREAKLSVGASFLLPSLTGLYDGVEALPQAPRTLHTTYLDTDDLRLARWGCSLRFRDGEGWTVKLPPAREGDLLVRGEHVFPGNRTKPPADALDLLRAYLRSAAVVPVVRLRTVRTAVVLRIDRTGSPRNEPVGEPASERAGEIVDDEVSVLDGPRVAARFREIEVELAEGSPDALLDTALARLRAAGAGDAGFTPKYVRALGPRAEQPAELVVVPFSDPSVADLVRAALTSPTIDLLRNDAGVRLGDDPDAVHEVRVGTRRLRSALRTFRSVLDPAWAAGLRLDLGWLGSELGAVRDADVLETVLGSTAARLTPADRPAASGLLGQLERQRESALQELRAAMSSDRYVALLDALVAAAFEPSVLPQAAGLPAKSLGPLMEAPWQRLERACRKLGPRSSDADLHRARIMAKRVRYAAEALAPAFGSRADDFAAAAASLQGVLGTHHDAVMAAAWLRAAAVQVIEGVGTNGDDGPNGGRTEMAFAAGLMTERQRRVADRTRATWRRAWKALDRPKLRFWR